MEAEGIYRLGWALVGPDCSLRVRPRRRQCIYGASATSAVVTRVPMPACLRTAQPPFFLNFRSLTKPAKQKECRTFIEMGNNCKVINSKTKNRRDIDNGDPRWIAKGIRTVGQRSVDTLRYYHGLDTSSVDAR